MNLGRVPLRGLMYDSGNCFERAVDVYVKQCL